nr:MAG TPA: hypothetical protein [Caudoviricetes sp.]
MSLNFHFNYRKVSRSCTGLFPVGLYTSYTITLHSHCHISQRICQLVYI